MNLLMKLLKVKWVFNKPKKKKILIYDKMSEENGFAEIFFQKKDYEILYRRYEKINLYQDFLGLAYYQHYNNQTSQAYFGLLG